jgi:hypothetical protein
MKIFEFFLLLYILSISEVYLFKKIFLTYEKIKKDSNVIMFLLQFNARVVINSTLYLAYGRVFHQDSYVKKLTTAFPLFFIVPCAFAIFNIADSANLTTLSDTMSVLRDACNTAISFSNAITVGKTLA